MARVKVNGEGCMALLDNGTQVNTIMSGYVENHSMDIWPLSELVGSWVACVGLGNALTWPIGYIIIWIQVDRVQGYNEDQITLVIPDLSNFMAWVPMILETPTIGHIMNVIKESKMGVLETPWVNTQVAYLLVVQHATAMVEDDKVTTKALTLLNMMKLSSPKRVKWSTLSHPKLYMQGLRQHSLVWDQMW